MNRIYHCLLCICLCVIACHSPSKKNTSERNSATVLLKEMVTAMGGIESYQELKDISFTYNYRDLTTGKADVSTEKYLYKGEWSWAKYETHNKNIFPELKEPVIQSWNGKEAWLQVGDSLITDPFHLKMTDFSRKTAFFWFNMMYKMLDKGTIYKSLPDRTFNGKGYKIVEVTYEKNIGDVQDRFVLYINPKSKLVEHFLFSNAHFSEDAPPRIMHITFQEVEGMKFPERMHYEPADWNGNVAKVQEDKSHQIVKSSIDPNGKPPPPKGPGKSEKLFTDIKLNTGIEKSLYQKPVLE